MYELHNATELVFFKSAHRGKTAEEFVRIRQEFYKGHFEELSRDLEH